MKYTKAQRHRIYKEVLASIEAGYHSFICNAIYQYTYLRVDFAVDFPEFWKQRPHRQSYAWFAATTHGKNRRIAILRKAIQQTKPKPKKK